MELPVEGVKGLVLTGLFILTFFCSSLPIKLYTVTHDHDSSHHRRWRRAISFLSCFAAGVFLGTCLLHLFPDVDNSLANVMDRSNILTSFPVSEFVMVFGFFLILVVEQVVLMCKENHAGHDAFDHHHHNDHDEHKRLLNASGNGRKSNNNYGYLSPAEPESETASLAGSDHGSINEPFPTLTSSGEHDHSDYSVHVDQSSHSTIRSFILLLALSLHAVFEGLAVGLERTSSNVVQLFSALVLHKCILGFSLGLNLVQSKLSRSMTITATFVFSIMSPLGVGIGIIVDDMSDSIAANAASGVLQGIACGTFLYVTFFEVLPHEFNSKDDRMLKVLFLIIGYSVLVILLFLNPDSDNIRRCSGGSTRPIPSGGANDGMF